MGLIPDQGHLSVIDPAFEATRKQTFPGMAHFAGTGPSGESCRNCVHWTGCGFDSGYFAKKGMYGGTIKPRACAKHKELMGGEVGNAIPHNARACKYFEATDKPPPVLRPA